MSGERPIGAANCPESSPISGLCPKPSPLSLAASPEVTDTPVPRTVRSYACPISGLGAARCRPPALVRPHPDWCCTRCPCHAQRSPPPPPGTSPSLTHGQSLNPHGLGEKGAKGGSNGRRNIAMRLQCEAILQNDSATLSSKPVYMARGLGVTRAQRAAAVRVHVHQRWRSTTYGSQDLTDTSTSADSEPLARVCTMYTANHSPCSSVCQIRRNNLSGKSFFCDVAGIRTHIMRHHRASLICLQPPPNVCRRTTCSRRSGRCCQRTTTSG